MSFFLFFLVGENSTNVRCDFLFYTQYQVVQNFVLPENKMFLPELHDAGHVSRGVDAADEVEVADIEASINAPGQSHGGQELVPLSLSVTAGARDAPAPSVPHHGGNHGGLQGDELVLPTAFVEDA